MNWFEVKNIDRIDSPALLVYRDRVESNIDLAISMRGKVQGLIPHVKTHKMGEVADLMMDRGIYKFKCATIAEAEMLAIHGAAEVLLAHQPTPPKIQRLVRLMETYPDASFAAIVDDANIANLLSDEMESKGRVCQVFIDVDVGMQRTGTPPENVKPLFEHMLGLKGVQFAGLHVYDGHLRDPDMPSREKACDECFEPVEQLKADIQTTLGRDIRTIAGGSPTFPIHVKREGVECSPGTFVFWDWGYSQKLSEQKFDHAACVITRVISKLGSDKICTDLGHKSIASENPYPRVLFLNRDAGVQVGHSEEHMVLDVGDNSEYKVGDLLYGIPFHICPTTALYERAYTVKNQVITGYWRIVSRDRKITV